MGVPDFQSGTNTIIPFVFLWEVMLRGFIIFKSLSQNKIKSGISTDPFFFLSCRTIGMILT